jgi:hypothetical protein
MSLHINDEDVCLTPTPSGPCYCYFDRNSICSNGHYPGVAGFARGRGDFGDQSPLARVP